MARAAVLGRLNWRAAQLVAVRDESATARTLILDVPGWPGHLPGQHVDVRLTAEDGYSTQRSYSIASAPAGARLELTVERLENGEVSPYLTDELHPGDPLELRGPIGGWFVWHPGDLDPVLLLGGGSGVVPLMAIVRTRIATGSTTPMRLVYSTRTPTRCCTATSCAALPSGTRPCGWTWSTPAAPRRAGKVRWGGWMGPAGHSGLAAHGPARLFCVRPDRVCGGCGQPAGRPGVRARTDQDRTVRTKRRLKGAAMTGSMMWTDGNALAGPLHDVFRPDVTAAMAGCSNCGWTGPMAGVRVFDHAPGVVARCATCDQVLLRMVHGPGRAWLDLRGLSYLQLPMTDET